MRTTRLKPFIRIAATWALMVLCMAASGQKQKFFSGDSARFAGELNAVFVNLSENEKKLIAPGMEEFLRRWNQEHFDAGRKVTIYRILNEMARNKVRPYPDFYNYFKALNVCAATRQPGEVFDAWSEIVEKLLAAKSTRPFNAFTEASTALFDGGYLYKSPTTRWKISNPSFRFRYDTVPAILVGNTDLVCYSGDDSLRIKGTRGTCYPLTGEWRGEGGTVDWQRAGVSPDQVYASLEKYSVRLRFSRFSADSVMFYHKKYFPNGIPGKFSDHLLTDVKEDRESYPRFYSFDKRIGISGLFRNIDYLGGFAMEGSRIIGFGGESKDAALFFKRDGRDFVIARSRNFVIRPERISSGRASVTIYHESDSIFHSGLQLKYTDELRELSFQKDERVTTLSPWFDSYHNIEIYCEALYWTVGEPVILFQKMKGPTKESKAVFESSSYYSAHRYDRLKGIDEINPLNIIRRFTNERKTKEFSLEAMTDYFRRPAEQVEAQLINLADRGFLVYDVDTKKAYVNDKLGDYVDAQAGKSDYDAIFFNSLVAGGANGVLSLDSFDLRIQGVREIILSDTQQVHVYPKNMEVILKKDMNFLFSGRIEAGLFDFYAKDCYFDYGRFLVNLPTIDSMLFYVRGKTFDRKQRDYPLEKVKTAITNLSGVLLIDDPRNKSGLKFTPDYPVFTNKAVAYVNWNKGSIQNGQYPSDRFFYQVHPFTIRSMDNLVTDTLQFKGSLATAGIFPDIDEPLRIRPDRSLGLETTTDSSGYPVYGGKGRFTAHIDLSNRGLRGEGTLTYLNSKTVSKDFLFLPDSMFAMADRFDMTERAGPVEFPAVHGDSVRQFWAPYRDSLSLISTTREFAMYNNQSSFAGRLTYTPRMLSGDGNIRIRDAVMDSRAFRFSRRTFDALIANFSIKSYDLAQLSISTRNYQTHFDFDQRRGEFKSNVGISEVNFPLNQYVCSMDRFDWLIDSEEILLANEQSRKSYPDTLSLAGYIDVGYTGAEFISVHPRQESLKFFAAKARYNLRTNVINAEDVRIIKVADAAVFPDSGKVTILKEAQMKTLHRAIILADTQTRLHQFYNADVSIASRTRYTAAGDYDYRQRNGVAETIRFTHIRVDSARRTTGEGRAGDSAAFFLSPEFAFRGAFRLKASVRDLWFDGGFHPVTDCFGVPPLWVRFEGYIDPAHVRIPVNPPLRTLDGEPVSLGILFANAGFRINPSFFRPRISVADSLMVTAGGMIEYNLPTEEFRIADTAKLKDLSKPGSYLALHTGGCKLRGEGKINLSLRPEPVRLETFGILDYFILPDSIRLRCAMTLQFPFSERGLQKLATALESVNLPGVKLMETPYATAAESMLEPADFKRLSGELSLLGKYRKFPDALEKTFFMADISMKYDTNTKSYVSFGDLGIASAGKAQVNRYVKGIMELSRKRNGDELSIYLELTESDWFYFNYRNKILMVLSSDPAFNDLIREDVQSRAEQKRISNLAKGFSYTLATERKKREFLRKFEPAETE